MGRSCDSRPRTLVRFRPGTGVHVAPRRCRMCIAETQSCVYRCGTVVRLWPRRRRTFFAAGQSYVDRRGAVERASSQNCRTFIAAGHSYVRRRGAVVRFIAEGQLYVYRYRAVVNVAPRCSRTFTAAAQSHVCLLVALWRKQAFYQFRTIVRGKVGAVVRLSSQDSVQLSHRNRRTLTAAGQSLIWHAFIMGAAC